MDLNLYCESEITNQIVSRMELRPICHDQNIDNFSQLHSIQKYYLEFEDKVYYIRNAEVVRQNHEDVFFQSHMHLLNLEKLYFT